MSSPRPIHVIGAGLAGSQAALTIARLGGEVILYEMRPVKQTAAHRTPLAAELVCSNSLRSDQPYSAPWLLKQEMRMLGGELIEIAMDTAVPGGTALTVDREAFSRRVTAALEASPHIRICRQEVEEIPAGEVCVITTGPLTSESLAQSIQALTGEDNLAFFDAINPVVDAETVNLNQVFAASRYGKGGSDFLNCPLTRDQYLAFWQALLQAESYSAHDFDEPAFWGCPPLEKLARSGPETLRFGPLRPVGLRDPRTGREPYAVVQLRRENLRSDSYNLVGFQNQLKFGDQKRVFQMIPGLQNAEFIRFGQMHRNTYIRAPRLLTPALHLRHQPQVFFGGQLGGVEGYVESMATGLLAGVNAWRRSRGQVPLEFPRQCGLGAVCHYLAHAEPEHFAPVRLTFDLLPLPQPPVRDRLLRRRQQCLNAQSALRSFLSQYDLNLPSGETGRKLGENPQIAAQSNYWPG